ncbi:type 1 glutamine amidotransferase [Ferruginibacter albus]|uniref:type 1 glutamine amidotransferase n=1 Tax=Ferruginibacter albus TaxID=2875540 RepID=UPI001CC71271|nr:type 1 glutamine amidotransferase [Ferruginibacter albus]UAY52976.1 type 1 glutamine amidotransferase [Ferruginibacter albus]
MKIHFIQHVPFEHPAYIGKWAEQNGHSFSITHIYNNETLPSLKSFDMLVMMGGPMGAYDEDKFEWLVVERQFVKAAIDANKKVLGICLGCQIIAAVLGGNVYPHTQKEIGWWKVKKIEANKKHALLKDLPEEFTTFHWHGDTFDLPENAIQLFQSEATLQQGFAIGNNIAALQFHPEVEENLLASLTEHDRDELKIAPYIQPEKQMNELLPLHIENQHRYISSFLDAFVSL